MTDLTLALRAAADRATADLTPPPASPVLTRIHRRRTVRYASQGAVGLAAAGAAVVGGVHVAGRPSAPGPAATSLADASAVRCGAELDAFDQPTGAPDVTLLLSTPDASTDAPVDAEVPLVVVAEAAPDAVRQAGSAVTYALVQGRTVVGLPDASWVDDQPTDFEGDGSQASLYRWSDVRFAACQADGTLAGSPEPGTYGVVAFLSPDEATDWPIPFRSNGVVMHLGDPLGADGQRPALQSLVVSADGIGPVRLGDPAPSEGPAAVVEYREDSCVAVFGDTPARIGSQWAATYAHRATPYGTQAAPFGLLVDDGRVTGVEVVTSGPRTEAGVQVGDTLADLRAAHPDVRLVGHAAASGSIPGRDVWAVVDGDRMLAFEVATEEHVPEALPIEPGTVAAIVATTGTSYGDRTVALGGGCS